MSSDAVARVLVVAAITAAALAIAFAAPRLSARRAERSPLDLRGIDGGIILFTDRSCQRCRRVRAMLADLGIDPVEYAYEDHPGDWDRVGVSAVPLLVIRGADGTVTGTIAGLPSRRRLRRAVG